jgi:membrane protease YdiL (CAAX protease family)
VAIALQANGPTAPDRRQVHRLADRQPVGLFIAIAFAMSWWPALGRVGNPESAVVIPIGPSIAGVLVVGWRARRHGLAVLWDTERGTRVGTWWWALLIPVGIALGASGLSILLGATAPNADDVAMSAVLVALLPLTMLVAGPLGEELGWRGFLLPHLLQTRTPWRATLTLLPVWLAFHLPLVATNPSRYGLPWAIVIAALAITMTWLHEGTGGSLRLAVVFHAAVNTAASASIQAFSDQDQALVAAVTAGLWLAVGGAVALGPLRPHPQPNHHTTHEGTHR